MGDARRPTSADDLSMRREDGQTMAEYSVTLGVIVVGIVATFGLFSEAVRQMVLRAADLIVP
jgi:Flp pilus assembly pilin Flp